MTPEQLLAHLLAAGAVYSSYRGIPPEVLVHAELLPAGLFYVALPAENQSHCHFVPADRAMVTDDRYLVLFGRGGDSEPIGQVAGVQDVPEVGTDEAVQDLATWRAEVGAFPAWEAFVQDQRDALADITPRI